MVGLSRSVLWATCSPFSAGATLEETHRIGLIFQINDEDWGGILVDLISNTEVL